MEINLIPLFAICTNAGIGACSSAGEREPRLTLNSYDKYSYFNRTHIELAALNNIGEN